MLLPESALNQRAQEINAEAKGMVSSFSPADEGEHNRQTTAPPSGGKPQSALGNPPWVIQGRVERRWQCDTRLAVVSGHVRDK